MQKPAGTLIVPVVKSVTVKPETAPFVVFHAVIISRPLVPFPPPFGRDTLRSLRTQNPMGDFPPVKNTRWPFRHFGNDIDGFGRRQQAQGSRQAATQNPKTNKNVV